MSEYARRVYRLTFTAAAAYNIVFGLWASLRPHAFFTMFDLEPVSYPAIWSCLGMVVGLYGVGYGYAALRLDRAFPFLAIGLAGKVLGPIGWVISVRSGELPFRTFPLIVFDDLIWWLPFAMFLLEGTRVTKWLSRTAPYWCAALHAVAALGTLALLRGGSEAVADIDRRVGWLTDHPGLWRAGWLLWMMAAISLTAFYAWWGSRVPIRPALIALVIAAIGLACDFAGESILMAWVPRPDSSLYRSASLLSAAAGNGLYTIAGMTLTIFTPPLRSLSWIVWLSGSALTVATIANAPAAITIASAALMTLFIPFVLLLARRLP